MKTKVCLVNCCVSCLPLKVEVGTVVGGQKGHLLKILIRKSQRIQKSISISYEVLKFPFLISRIRFPLK